MKRIIGFLIACGILGSVLVGCSSQEAVAEEGKETMTKPKEDRPATEEGGAAASGQFDVPQVD